MGVLKNIVVGGVIGLVMPQGAFAATKVYSNPDGFFDVFVHQDTPNRFRATIIGTDFPVCTDCDPDPTPHPGVGGDGFHDMNLYVGNWALTWTIDGFGNDVHVPDQDKPLIDGKEIVPTIGLQHVNGPHGEGPGDASFFIPTWITNGTPAPQGAPLGVTFFGPHGGHLNKHSFWWDPHADGYNFLIWSMQIRGGHAAKRIPGPFQIPLNHPIPLPAAAWMGLSLLSGTAAVSKLRRKFQNLRN